MTTSRNTLAILFAALVLLGGCAFYRDIGPLPELEDDCDAGAE